MFRIHCQDQETRYIIALDGPKFKDNSIGFDISLWNLICEMDPCSSKLDGDVFLWHTFLIQKMLKIETNALLRIETEG